MKPAKYYKVTVTLKNGFVYSYSCMERQLAGMKRSSEGYWTEKLEVVEITEEEHRSPYIFVEEKTTEKKVRAKKHDKVEKPKKLEPESTTVPEKTTAGKNPVGKKIILRRTA